MNLSEEKKILKNKGYKLIEVYGNSDSEILADPSFWDYSKQVQHRFKNDGGFIIKPEEQEKLLNNRYYINILKDNSIRLPKQYIQRFTQPFVEKIILACYKGNMNVKDAAYYLGEFSYQAGTMIKSDWEQWVARQLSTFNESINKQLKLGNNMKLNEGIFSEIDNAIQEYIMHVKKFDAPVSVDDCIDFCADVLDMDVNALWELENSNGTISDCLSEYFNEGFRQTHRHLIKEAKKVLEKNGYIVK